MTKNWQNIILGEWYNTWDEEYALKLFELVANESVSNIGRMVTVFLGISCGILMGVAVSYISPREFDFQKYLIFTGIGSIIGGLFAATKQELSWYKFLILFTPKFSHSILSRLNNFVIVCLLLTIIGLLIGASVDFLMAGLTYALDKPFTFQKLNQISLLDFLILIFGPAFGLWLGNAVFRTGGWVVGIIGGLGFVITDNILASFGPLLVPVFIALPKAAFMIGLSVSGILFLDPNLSRAKGELNQSHYQNLFRYRGWWIWWWNKPNYLDLEIALKQATEKHSPDQNEWVEILEQLKIRRTSRYAVVKLVDSFKNGDWKERFSVRQTLRKISQDTHTLVKNSSTPLFCADCFTRIHSHEISLLADDNYIFYGCRECHQYENFFSESDSVVAVLNVDMRENWSQNNGSLRVNWLKHRAVFDFDKVEIIRATDEDVERFAMQVGNDTDKFRQPRYKKMGCIVMSEAKLSTNSIKILRKTFENIVIK